MVALNLKTVSFNGPDFVNDLHSQGVPYLKVQYPKTPIVAPLSYSYYYQGVEKYERCTVFCTLDTAIWTTNGSTNNDLGGLDEIFEMNFFSPEPLL